MGDRLVDFQARLTNLQKTEANLQKIMDRAGSVRDVQRQLGRIRPRLENSRRCYRNASPDFYGV
ncbi:DUF4349 domain-containing protein [Nostoc favosum]|uniref:DUF4349 domain-containing protein n=1 Tax=Nostoc favosum TaxID=2907819 RepID=UPI001E501634|nr:DUF4349 domain-containing protein [Nostoc favosum]